ncbi:FAD-binding domain-containing protein [Ophiobolus disseminans]|uniref:FAD-binding domain-containing protein n=1 Tax=Ophiobolus disseminans TaxID=1469910 RepID=A0A6A6ZRF0_9PLEO|nr:FAD-binding domain-containing protein [Ophiobolus disseminans]
MATFTLIVLLTCIWSVVATTSTWNRSNACQSLSSKFPASIYTVGSSEYKSETQAYWSLAAWLEPDCVFAPASSSDLAGGVDVLIKSNTTFAIRSGGHAPTTGIASTGHGVLISMAQFKTLTLHDAPNKYGASYLRCGAANPWGVVYEFLGQHGLSVVAGRIWPVGTGALLGGALSFFSQQRGWGSNNIVNYEVVNADAKVVQVNAKSNPDLFWALKGGGNNFGIVTHYDMKTFKQDKIFGFNMAWPPEQMQKFSDAMTNWMLPGGGREDAKGALMPSTQYTPATDRLEPSLTALYDAPINNPAAFENFSAIAGTDLGNGVQNVSQLVNQTIGYSARVLRWKWYVTSIKFDKETMPIVIDTMVDVAKELIPKFDGFVGVAEEPITIKHLEAAKANGGDPMNLDPKDGGFLMALYYTAYSDPKLDETAENYLKTLISTVEKKTKAKNLFYDFYFLNDLGIAQDAFTSYKGGALNKLKAISRKYDPRGVFQHLVPGYKLGYLVDGS